MIDVGSNTIHLFVGIWDGCRLQTIDEASERTRLAVDVARDGVIGERKLRKLAELAATYAVRAEKSGAATIDIVATHAVRTAGNQAAVVGALREVSRHPVRILGTHEEAYLAALGTSVIARWSTRTAVVDIGGGSVQVAVADPGAVLWTGSVPLGTGSLGPELGEARLGQRALSGIKDRVSRALCGSLDGASGIPWGTQQVLVTGGALRRLSLFLGSPDRISLDALDQATALLNCSEGVGLAVSRGISPRSISVLRAGTLIAAEFLRLRGFSSCRFVPAGLREGAIIAATNLPLPLEASRCVISDRGQSPLRERLAQLQFA